MLGLYHASDTNNNNKNLINYLNLLLTYNKPK